MSQSRKSVTEKDEVGGQSYVDWSEKKAQDLHIRIIPRSSLFQRERLDGGLGRTLATDPVSLVLRASLGAHLHSVGRINWDPEQFSPQLGKDMTA